MTRDAFFEQQSRNAHAETAVGTASGFGLADMALLCTLVAVPVLFLISPVTMEAWGFAYLTSGGGILTKFHPSTLIASLAFALRCMATRHPARSGWRLLTSDPGVTLLLTAVMIAGFCAIFIDHTPVTPLVDTFVLPILVFLLLRDLDPAIVRWLALTIAIILCANAVMALIEFARGAHLITIEVPYGATPDPRRGDTTFDWRAELALDWRATALLGHPLSNGLIVGCFILCLSASGSRWIPAFVKLPVFALQIISMAAFGARSALVLSIVFAALLWLSQGMEALARGVRLQPRQMLAVILVTGLVIGGGALLLEAGLLDRTIDRFLDDGGSAKTRVVMFNMFQPLSWSDMLFGPDSDLVATWQRLEGLEFGIESSWIGLALTYGLIVTSMLLIGLCAFSLSIIRASGRGTILVLALYFILVSVSAAMSGKTTTFALIVSLAMVFLRRDERQDLFWSAARVGSA